MGTPFRSTHRPHNRCYRASKVCLIPVSSLAFFVAAVTVFELPIILSDYYVEKNPIDGTHNLPSFPAVASAGGNDDVIASSVAVAVVVSTDNNSASAGGNDDVTAASVAVAVSTDNNNTLPGRPYPAHLFIDKKLILDADAHGKVFDFVIAGFPKCGTTTMVANLGHVAPVPGADVCTPVHNSVYYAYVNWPVKFATAGESKPLRGMKCPMFIDGDWLLEWSAHLPRTGVIVGIRHPVLWFQSFYNMQANFFSKPLLPVYRYNATCSDGKTCRSGCPNNWLFCTHRARFHVTLARLGKTPMGDAERSLLAPNDFDGGLSVQSLNIRNPVFLYESSQIDDDVLWEDLADFLSYAGEIPHNKFIDSRGPQRSEEMKEKVEARKIDICEPTYDNFRKELMPYAWQMSRWICDYFVPSGDVRVTERFCSIVRGYENDPCGRLVHMGNGTYILNKTLTDR